MSRKRILLIDDEKSLSTVIQACLENLADWTVLKAESGREGLLKAQTEKLNAILLDVMMPDLDGFTVLQELKKNPVTQSIPVMLITAKVEPTKHEQYAQLGIAGVINKPFDPLRLAEQVAGILGWN
ncbi:response regulator receiver domain protein [Tolypothrix tenuis PCC 7101]|uniref:Response regulator receiver domain protein n=1 Tax=Tolypothrix tenuis PCC 7101 TaxID=231146 RepID=A0A1Z4N7X5_9CYAN|nr:MULTISPECIES: response regulator [unclassified Tolypothrix]MBD2238601.1 response regulator [Aulosira sp. FACHB-113]BAY91864.1 response regulator receiver domain protein [Microchaete diplosiphon NIES-3275]BAZ01824.1 response regulator receiver domain protein [Tolypothrix tenuis PCC 7101]BAZ74251.1 response regulator receiver domain protein [Aulosira laxa NIES-50]EKF04972.1 response regulator [Tolypothrix sp. PCC 7601]